MKYLIITILFLFSLKVSLGQTKFKVKAENMTGTWKKRYSLIDEKGKTIRKLDTSKYKLFLYENSYKYFTVIGIKGMTGFQAIDENEKILFDVYNVSKHEISPDVLRENKIRIKSNNGKIGFANHKGKVIIEPQFERVTSFHNGKAIISKSCEEKQLDQEKPHGIKCHHTIIKCLEHGYIDENGKVLKLGTYTFDEIKKEIGWEPRKFQF